MQHMEHILFDIALIFVSSMLLSLGFLAFGQPPLLGYIIAGIVLMPTVNSLTLNANIVHTMGEFGMILLLFMVGLELSLVDFKKFWLSAFVCFVTQTVLACILIFGIGYFFGLSTAFSLVLIFNLILSSTAIVVTLLENLNILHGRTGMLAISLLIAQDLSLVPMLLILRSFQVSTSFMFLMAQLIIAIGILFGCIFYFGRKHETLKKQLEYKTLLRKPEIVTLIGGAFCFFFASLSDIVKLSPSYGAFIAGLILGNRWDRDMLVRAFSPITSLLMMIFFLSVGTRLSPVFIWTNMGSLSVVLISLTAFKVLSNMLGLKILKWHVRPAFFTAVLLGQCSEFGFLLIDEATKNLLITLPTANFLTSLVTLSLCAGAIFPVIVSNFQYRKLKKNEHKAIHYISPVME